MEESSDEEEEVPAAALETDLEKYLKLPELPLTMWPTGLELALVLDMATNNSKSSAVYIRSATNDSLSSAFLA